MNFLMKMVVSMVQISLGNASAVEANQQLHTLEPATPTNPAGNALFTVVLCEYRKRTWIIQRRLWWQVHNCGPLWPPPSAGCEASPPLSCSQAGTRKTWSEDSASSVCWAPAARGSPRLNLREREQWERPRSAPSWSSEPTPTFSCSVEGWVEGNSLAVFLP